MSDWTRRDVANAHRDRQPPDKDRNGLSIMVCVKPRPVRMVAARDSVVDASSYDKSRVMEASCYDPIRPTSSKVVETSVNISAAVAATSSSTIP